ncbi:MAG: hypothetical protein JJE47_17705 [Acidimicrobiia bacterium]|nr:hypothetical protein [Acidimicrobiia bacterium]
METLDTVLVDCVSDYSQEAAQLERRGHHVVYCAGPPRATLCPILRKGFCEKIAAASGVIFDLDLDRAQHRAILARYREVLGSEIPIRVMVSPRQAVRYAELLAPNQAWTQHPTITDVDDFAAALETIDG